MLITILLIPILSFGQVNSLDPINFAIGEWIRTGSGFGNNISIIESEFQYIMDNQYN